MTTCVICESPVREFMSFGRQPLGNGFLAREQFANEYFFEMRLGFCSSCKMVQLLEVPEPERMFNENYAFFSGTSTRMAEHFKVYAESIRGEYLDDTDPFVVEMGSNDGIMLKHFKAAGIRHLGVDPSKNVGESARRQGIETLTAFFSEETAQQIVAKHGQADALLAANVMCHIPYLHSIFRGADVLLKPKGVLVFEDPYLGDVVEKTSYDQVYDEHTFLFSVTSVQNAVARHGMEVIDARPQATHGGSMRYIIAREGRRPVQPAVARILAKEEAVGLSRFETYEKFRGNCERSRDRLLEVLRQAKQEGKRVVGYAATSKSTTITNYCGITPDLIEFISDTTPLKQGKFSPGAHIPVLPYEKFKSNYPDYAILFGWNHKDEIMAKEKDFTASGGKWIVYVPEVKILVHRGFLWVAL